jgi:hypothetical protein
MIFGAYINLSFVNTKHKFHLFFKCNLHEVSQLLFLHRVIFNYYFFTLTKLKLNVFSSFIITQ